uniref:Collectrin n=1 Tax=Ciona intestinalis TaxID=7719 RepID=H2Y276_CIOIN|nr:collectrin [Ciona intestinalis]|eukprot:XP_002129052.1 collectrin [Ciona intestinalis]
MNTLLVALAILVACVTMGHGLTCTSPDVKITIKITDPTEFDHAERYLFTGVMAYSFRKYCSVFNPMDTRCTDAYNNTIDTADVNISHVTDRFAMCVKVTLPSGVSASPKFIEDVVRTTQPRFNGALVLTDTTLLFQGIPPTLKPQVIPDFPTWLIPFIVFVCLVVLAAIAILSYSAYQAKHKKLDEKNGDNESLNSENHAYEVYENGNGAGSITML